MKPLSLFITLSSLIVVLVTIERFSPTTKILLQPDNFLRLHEVVQMTVIILLSALIPCGILYLLSDRLTLVKTPYGKLLAVLFIIGIYLYATGNGLHEVSSFLFNTFCPQKNFTSPQCKSMFFNDYYFGNSLYFIGAFFMTIPLMLFEQMNPQKNFKKNDYLLLLANSGIYALAIIAYAAFDTVLVGFFYVVISTAIALVVLFTAKRKYTHLPYTLYTVIAYTLGTGIASIIRFH